MSEKIRVYYVLDHTIPCKAGLFASEAPAFVGSDTGSVALVPMVRLS
jgi:hypothetical protein